MIDEMDYRILSAYEIPLARDVVSRNSDAHTCYVVQRLPSYFDIYRAIDPDISFYKRQRLAIGAFHGDTLAGTVFVEPVHSEDDVVQSDVPPEELRAQFSEHQFNVFNTLQTSLTNTMIGAPHGAMSVHSLSVLPRYRRTGVGTNLLAFTLKQLTRIEQDSTYIEFARIKWLTRLGEAAGFTTVKKTFSISERLEYGYWGSVLMRYASPKVG